MLKQQIAKLKDENEKLREDLKWAVDTANYWVDNIPDKKKCVELEYRYQLKINYSHEE